MKNLFKISVAVLILVSVSFGQFGKNRVQYKDYKWVYIYTKHFDINIYISRVYYRLNKGGNNKNV